MSEQDLKSSFHNRSVEQVIEMMDAEPQRGLTKGEVRHRIEKYGPNKLREAKRRSVWEILIEQFKSMVIVALIVAGSVAFALQHWAGLMFDFERKALLEKKLKNVKSLLMPT